MKRQKLNDSLTPTYKEITSFCLSCFLWGQVKTSTSSFQDVGVCPLSPLPCLFRCDQWEFLSLWVSVCSVEGISPFIRSHVVTFRSKLSLLLITESHHIVRHSFTTVSHKAQEWLPVKLNGNHVLSTNRNSTLLRTLQVSPFFWRSWVVRDSVDLVYILTVLFLSYMIL